MGSENLFFAANEFDRLPPFSPAARAPEPRLLMWINGLFIGRSATEQQTF